MVCITWRKKQTTASWRQPRENYKTEWKLSIESLLYRVQKELWTESLAIFQQTAHQGRLSCLRFAFNFADFTVMDPIHCPFWGGRVFSILEWQIRVFQEYLFHLLVFSLHSLFFPWHALFELLWEIFLKPKFEANVIKLCSSLYWQRSSKSFSFV